MPVHGIRSCVPTDKSPGETMETIRTFIAIDIPQEVKMELDKLISSLKPFAPDLKWVKAANLHLTLRFLGDVSKDSIKGLEKMLAANINSFGGFQVALSGVGGFPNLKRARVIWVGTGTGTDKLTALAPLIEKSCVDCDFGEADKPFSSHLTIGRVKFPKSLDRLAVQLESTKFESAPFDVEEVVIFKSDLSPSGPKYTRLETIKV
jgi:RNA 2',3'-cyclic 3'-phosphodiesterase